MIAATRRRIRTARRRATKRLRGAAPGLLAETHKLDRWVNRQLERSWPWLARLGRRFKVVGIWLGRRLRPVGVLLLRAFALLEKGLLRTIALARGAATRASAVLTPQRAICLTILASAGFLIAAQFTDYRAVEIGQPGYVGLPAAAPPTVDAKTAGEAHSYLLIPVAVVAALLALAAIHNERRRGLGRIVFLLGLLSLAVVLLVDLPAGLDTGAQAARFSGTKAVLYDGFYAQIAAAAGLMLGGLLLSNAYRLPTRYGYRPRKPSLARTQGGRRRARTSGA